MIIVSSMMFVSIVISVGIYWEMICAVTYHSHSWIYVREHCTTSMHVYVIISHGDVILRWQCGAHIFLKPI